jgi:hypothetical protein
MELLGDYDADGYALVRRLVPGEICRAFLNQLKGDVERSGGSLDRLTRGSALLKRDAIEVYGYHYPPMLGLLWGMTPIVSRLLGRELLPSYDYFRIYREGDVCRVHSDRYSCEVSLSLTLDYSDGVTWDLEVGSDPAEAGARVEEDFAGDAYRSVTMMPGDGVLYQGVTRRHGRITPNPNLWSAHLFMHWVTRDAPYAEHAFDGNAATTAPINFAFR